MKKFASIFLATCLLGGHFSQAFGFTFTSTPTFQPATGQDRTLVIISDLHLGLGKDPAGSWHAEEDFRWPKAFKAFLDEISRQGNDRVDLLIAGDFLEMWQPPAQIHCQGVSADLGCTIPEMTTIASLIVQGHPQVFASLKAFSLRGQNRLHLIPGNHDAALLIRDVWEPVGKALDAATGRVNFLASGIWVSADGKILVEHGHQIGNEANRYDTWPNIVRQENGKEYIIRPWGERFVQKIFNQQEKEYPIIDNLSPESAGVWYRMQDRGIGGSAIDLARFVAFNLFQTSMPQKGQILGGGQSPEAKPEWDLAESRRLGHRLFLAAVPKADPFRAQLSENTDKARETIRELDVLALDAKRLPDEDVKMLCDQAANQGNPICKTELGATVERLLVPKERVFAVHLNQKLKEFPRLRYFIYGHTHHLEEAWPVGTDVQVLNSGAFQRIIDHNGFNDRVKRNQISPSDGLKKIDLEEMPPCYTLIRVSYENGGLKPPEVRRWVMKESDNTGRVVSPEDPACK